MSTKAIESVLKWVAQGGHPDVEQALTELERIRSASRVVVDVLSPIPPQYDATEPMTHALDVLSDVVKESK